MSSVAAVTEPSAVAALSAHFEADRLRGFWDEAHNMPSRLRLVQGSAPRFARDRAAAYARSQKRLDRYSGRALRWRLLPRSVFNLWDFTEESWQC